MAFGGLSGIWGQSRWGLDYWGAAREGEVAPTIYEVSPGLLEVEGGTILTIVGADFFPEFIPQVVSGPPGGPYELLAEGYLFDPEYDLTPDRALPGMPPMVAGVYSLRVSTPAGLSNVLENALTYAPFADEVIIQKVRSAWSAKWRVGARWGA